MAEWIIEIKDGKFPIGKWTKLVRCKDCKHRDDEFVCKYDSWDPFERSRPSYEDDWFCADGEPKESNVGEKE